MKKYALILTLIATSVQAEKLAWMDNEAGGKIVLTDEPCVLNSNNVPEARKIVAYSLSNDNKGPNEGCWGIYKHDKELIYAIWPKANQTKLYRMDDFTWIPKSKGTM